MTAQLNVQERARTPILLPPALPLLPASSTRHRLPLQKRHSQHTVAWGPKPQPCQQENAPSDMPTHTLRAPMFTPLKEACKTFIFLSQQQYQPTPFTSGVSPSVLAFFTPADSVSSNDLFRLVPPLNGLGPAF